MHVDMFYSYVYIHIDRYNISIYSILHIWIHTWLCVCVCGWVYICIYHENLLRLPAVVTCTRPVKATSTAASMPAPNWAAIHVGTALFQRRSGSAPFLSSSKIGNTQEYKLNNWGLLPLLRSVYDRIQLPSSLSTPWPNALQKSEIPICGSCAYASIVILSAFGWL